MKKVNRIQQGFSLLEIMVVVIIIGLIASYVASKVFGQGDNAKARLVKAQIQTVAGQLDIYKLDVGKYPNSTDGLKALVSAPAGVANWNGPYLQKPELLKDAWNNDFIYRAPGNENRAYEIISLGADGKEGGEGADRDINSW